MKNRWFLRYAQELNLCIKSHNLKRMISDSVMNVFLVFLIVNIIWQVPWVGCQAVWCHWYLLCRVSNYNICWFFFSFLGGFTITGMNFSSLMLSNFYCLFSPDVITLKKFSHFYLLLMKENTCLVRLIFLMFLIFPQIPLTINPNLHLM